VISSFSAAASMNLFILEKGHFDHIGTSDFQDINFVNIQNRVNQLTLNIVHKIYYRQTPEYLRPFFTRTSEVHRYNTRGSQYNFHIPTTANKAIVTKSFSYNAVKAWNALPNNIRNKSQYNSFKIALKHHLVHGI